MRPFTAKNAALKTTTIAISSLISLSGFAAPEMVVTKTNPAEAAYRACLVHHAVEYAKGPASSSMGLQTSTQINSIVRILSALTEVECVDQKDTFLQSQADRVRPHRRVLCEATEPAVAKYIGEDRAKALIAQSDCRPR